MNDTHKAVEALKARLLTARAVCVLTGAGMSAESGIPTFRDALTGYWARFDPTELASEAGFRTDPARVWAWYAERREAVRRAAPNAGHRALAAFAAAHPGVLTVVTQNVDNLHQRAGNGQAIRLHGDILADQWLEPCQRSPCAVGGETGGAAPGTPPRCAACGNLVRPGVVWFGEELPADALHAAQRAAAECEVMLVVGTSGAVWPAAGLAGQARRSGAFVAILNTEETEIDTEADLLLRGSAATQLPALLGAG